MNVYPSPPQKNRDEKHAVISAAGIHKQFTDKKRTVQALQDISFFTLPGEITGLVGADGAGKTTLIRIAAGLLASEEGTITVLGQNPVQDALSVQAAIGYMPQKFGLYQDLTVFENLRLYADLQEIPSAARQQRYDKLLTMTGLTPYTKRRAGALSGGMKQKLGLACALIKSPRLLLLDEPTVGVDPISRRELWKIVNELVQEDNIGVLLATAYLDEAEHCSHLLILHEGRLLAEGAPQEFSEKLREHVFLLSPSQSLSARSLHGLLAPHPQIADCTIRAGKVRVVLQKDTSLSRLLSAQDKTSNICSTPVPANFEDAFMSIIPQNSHHLPTNNPTRTEDSTGIHSQEQRLHSLVQVKRLQRFFGSFHAVRNLTFSVQRGEIFGLLGPNGAGKSTTFRMLCGLLPASSGTIEVAGYDMRSAGARARGRIGYMAQQFSLYGQLSIQENLTFFGMAYGLGGKKLAQRIDWAFKEFDLAPYSKCIAGTLPGGYKQRLAMAAALLHEPDILFLDEPTSGVDPFARREFWLRISRYAESGVTVIVTTHFMEEAEYCDRMLIMNHGTTLATGSPASIRELVRTPSHPTPSMDDAFILLAMEPHEKEALR